MTYQKIGTEFLGQLQNNPIYRLHDETVGWWIDKYVMLGVKCYYWPSLIISVKDDIADMFNPKTYNICK